MAPDAPHRRPGRPVADAPIERLIAHPEEVARRWMLALLAQVELYEAPGLVTEPFTRDGPRVCDAALRALAEDSDLRRLERGGALWPLVSRVGEMTGSTSAAHVLSVVDALHDVLWAELRAELRGTVDPELVAELAARLTRVCALIRDAGLERAEGGPGLEAVRPVGRAEGRGTGPMPPVPQWGPEPEAAAEPTTPLEPSGQSSVAPATPAADEPAGTPAAPAADEPAGTPVPPAADESVGAPAPPAADESPEPPGSPAPAASGGESEARPGPALWVEALEEEIRAATAAFAPLSLLLAELEDADRIAVSAGAERAGEAFGEFSRAVRRALRRQDILVQETAARAWVIARQTARAGAHSLGARIAESVGETSSLSGSPLVASVGVAVLGEDGVDSAQLMEAAEEARFAASARGIEVSRRMR
ncbi:MAG TPA: diguanylate cyclase [Solirubrobacteraceae bacterium]|nr:diguanylate cyclase [Solirubrobacteraceae bacterium]